MDERQHTLPNCRQEAFLGHVVRERHECVAERLHALRQFWVPLGACECDIIASRAPYQFRVKALVRILGGTCVAMEQRLCASRQHIEGRWQLLQTDAVAPVNALCQIIHAVTAILVPVETCQHAAEFGEALVNGAHGVDDAEEGGHGDHLLLDDKASAALVIVLARVEAELVALVDQAHDARVVPLERHPKVCAGLQLVIERTPQLRVGVAHAALKVEPLEAR